MQLEILIGIACMVIAAVAYAGYCYLSENVWLKC